MKYLTYLSPFRVLFLLLIVKIMKKTFIVLLACCVVLSLFLPLAVASESIGFIKSVSGTVFLENGDTEVKATKNMKIVEGDRIVTTGKSGVGVIFKDDTALSLGPKSEIEIKHFQFEPFENKLSFVTELFHGTFSFISGQIVKLAPDKVEIQTPNATLGVRGTKFLVQVD